MLPAMLMGRQRTSTRPGQARAGARMWSAGQALHLHLPAGSGASFLGPPTHNQAPGVLATSSGTSLTHSRHRRDDSRTSSLGVLGQGAELLGHHEVPQSLKSAFFHVSAHSPMVSQ